MFSHQPCNSIPFVAWVALGLEFASLLPALYDYL
jgi:hypothetical protein